MRKLKLTKIHNSRKWGDTTLIALQIFIIAALQATTNSSRQNLQQHNTEWVFLSYLFNLHSHFHFYYLLQYFINF